MCVCVYVCVCSQNKAAEELAGRGGAMAQQAIDMYVQRDDWDKVRADTHTHTHTHTYAHTDTHW